MWDGLFRIPSIRMAVVVTIFNARSELCDAGGSHNGVLLLICHHTVAAIAGIHRFVTVIYHFF